MLSKLLDRVAAVHEEAGITVDEGDAGGDRSGVEVGGVEDADAVGGVGGVDAVWGLWGGGFEGFEGCRGDGVVCDGDCDGLAGAVVCDSDGVVAFGGSGEGLALMWSGGGELTVGML